MECHELRAPHILAMNCDFRGYPNYRTAHGNLINPKFIIIIIIIIIVIIVIIVVVIVVIVIILLVDSFKAPGLEHKRRVFILLFPGA